MSLASNYRLEKFLPLAAVAVAVVPSILFFTHRETFRVELLLVIQALGWIIAAFLADFRIKLAREVDHGLSEYKLSAEGDTLEEKLGRYLKQSARFHRASYSFLLGAGGKNSLEVGESLREIAMIALKELNAKAVELSLFDKNSGLWSQAIILGDPSSQNTQSMLNEASEVNLLQIVQDGDYKVIKQELEFAGNDFGALRVELEKDQEVTEEDKQVLKLLGVHGALLLVDSEFTNELLRMRRTSEESVQAKTGFLANLSHEIRGPLGVILNGVELTMDGLCGPVTDLQKETLRMMKDNGDHLLDLVNDVLDYAKVEAGKISAKPMEIQVSELLKDLMTLVRSQAVAKGHKLSCEEVDPKLGVLCDKRHSRQILINFLTNAIKYTPEGGEVTLGAEREANNRLRVWIKDSGVGIPEEDWPKVFGAFERVDNKYSNAQVGTGLGMPLTKKLAEVNGGSVDFTSADGEGSTFWVQLPAVEIERNENEELAENSKEELPQGNGESILIVDHNDDTRNMYGQYLTNQGFKVCLAASGREVLKIIREEELSLAIVENDIPDIGGEDMVLAMRANPRVQRVPIILLSSKAFVFDIEHFIKLGVDRCLSKPVELIELAKTSRRLIDES